MHDPLSKLRTLSAASRPTFSPRIKPQSVAFGPILPKVTAFACSQSIATDHETMPLADEVALGREQIAMVPPMAVVSKLDVTSIG